MNENNSEGMTALMYASAKGLGKVLQALLAKGADVNSKNSEGMTAVDLAKDPATKALLLSTWASTDQDHNKGDRS